jgi:spermidine synthase
LIIPAVGVAGRHPLATVKILENMSVRYRYLLTCLCFCLSGVAALIYQIAWTRQFALVFGTSELAVATVLAAYMGGLALGARVVAAWLARITRPVVIYAALELGIAITAIALVPLCLWGAEQLLVSMLGGQAEPPGSSQTATTIFYLVAAFITLLIPTTLMGATLPLLVRDGVHSDEQIGRRVGVLYVCNTAGAVVGALLSALTLLPSLGLRGTVWTAATINVTVAVLAYALLRTTAAATFQDTSTPLSDRRFRSLSGVEVSIDSAVHINTQSWSLSSWMLPLMLLSGAVSFFHEVLWTRMLSHVVGSSIIAFGVMVASFLLGIALGGGVGSLLARSQATAIRAWVITQLAIAAAAILAWYGIQHWAPDTAALADKVWFGLAVLLPLSMAIGVTYPLAVRVVAMSADDAALASARVYTWNTAGAIVGALLGGFWLIPLLRYEGAVHLAVIVSALLAFAAVLLFMRGERRFTLVTGAASLLLTCGFWPQIPESLLRKSPLRSTQGELVYYSVGRGADVVVLRDDKTYDLRTNGLPEAGIDVLGAPPTVNVEAWMSPLAVLARPAISSMLVVGFGGGNAVQAVPPSVKQIDVIELEPEVIAANQAIAANRARNPLLDSRVNLILNDARGALLLTSKQYDAIVSQPSHPWTAGASHLYTREFMQQVHAHLTQNGIFVQWMSTDFMDESLLRSLLATVTGVFREVRVYRTSPNTLLFMGSDAPIEPERPDILRGVLARQQNHFTRIGINGVEDLLAALVLDTSGARRLANGSAIITDNNNRLATSGVHDFRRAMTATAAGKLLADYDPLTHSDSFVYQQIASTVSFNYLLRSMETWISTDATYRERILGVIELLGDTDKAAFARYSLALRIKQADAATQILTAGLQRWPDSELLNYAFMEPSIGLLASGKATPQLLTAASHLSVEPMLVIKAVTVATQEKWNELAAMDAQLAAIPWTAPWATQAAQLRVEWRARVGNKELRPRFGTEAIAIADRVLLSQADGFWYALRALNAVGTDQPQLMLESIAAFATLALDKASELSGAERTLAQSRAVQLRALLNELQINSRISATRWREVHERLLKVQALFG